MNKKIMKTIICFFALILVLLLCFVLYNVFSNIYTPNENEILLHIQLNIDDDIGLIVFDYNIDNAEYSGGISNANKSLLKKDSDNVYVLNKQELNITTDTIFLSMRFKIITEYADPNFENVYPDNITKYVNQVSSKMNFGESYFITITGDKTNGYTATLNNNERIE